jgi:hypothetical protein
MQQGTRLSPVQEGHMVQVDRPAQQQGLLSKHGLKARDCGCDLEVAHHLQRVMWRDGIMLLSQWFAMRHDLPGSTNGVPQTPPVDGTAA